METQKPKYIWCRKCGHMVPRRQIMGRRFNGWVHRFTCYMVVCRSCRNAPAKQLREESQRRRTAISEYNKAINSGLLKRGKRCVVCSALHIGGDKARFYRAGSGRRIGIVGHHSNYNKPLDVIWLCTAHHSAWHKVFETVR